MATSDEVRAVLDRYRTTGLGGSVPDSKRMAAALADAERTIRGLQRMVSCEDTDRECAGTKPDPPDKILSRCFVCQVAALREENERLHSTARDLVRALDAAARKGET